jgi:hypothetical protein
VSKVWYIRSLLGILLAGTLEHICKIRAKPSQNALPTREQMTEGDKAMQMGKFHILSLKKESGVSATFRPVKVFLV